MANMAAAPAIDRQALQVAAHTSAQIVITDDYKNLSEGDRWNVFVVGFLALEWPVAVYRANGVYYGRPLTRMAEKLTLVGTTQTVVPFHSMFGELRLTVSHYGMYLLYEHDGEKNYVMRQFRQGTVAIGVFPGATYSVLADGRVYDGSVRMEL